jgi:hypothetical protein
MTNAVDWITMEALCIVLSVVCYLCDVCLFVFCVLL